MKEIINDILDKYLKEYPNENGRQEKLLEFVKTSSDESLTDWNNFSGHIVASGFVYVKDVEKFLVLYHKDLKMYLYPGGHMTTDDINPLEACQREVAEETGLQDLTLVGPSIPFDIDTHMIAYNERLNLPAHLHFDFRYLFTVDSLDTVKLDEEEHRDYKLVSLNELHFHSDSKEINDKLKKLLNIEV